MPSDFKHIEEGLVPTDRIEHEIRVVAYALADAMDGGDFPMEIGLFVGAPTVDLECQKPEFYTLFREIGVGRRRIESPFSSPYSVNA